MLDTEEWAWLNARVAAREGSDEVDFETAMRDHKVPVSRFSEFRDGWSYLIRFRTENPGMTMDVPGS